MRQFVDEDHGRPALQGRIQIEFVQHQTTMFQALRRQDFQPGEQGFGVRAAVQLDIADNDVNPFGFELVRRFQHRIAFADARRGAKKDLQASALGTRFLFAYTCEQGVRIRTRAGRADRHAVERLSAVPGMGHISLRFVE